MAHPPIRAKVKTLDNKERQRRLEIVLEKARHSYVEVGITEPDDMYPDSQVSVGQVAAWMEFGTHSADGKEMVPSRSFLRTPVDNGIKTIEKVKNQQLEGLIQGKIGIETALTAIGTKVQLMMQNSITRGTPPPLADSTLRRKRALKQLDTPLIATRFMFDHIGIHVCLND